MTNMSGTNETNDTKNRFFNISLAANIVQLKITKLLENNPVTINSQNSCLECHFIRN